MGWDNPYEELSWPAGLVPKDAFDNQVAHPRFVRRFPLPSRRAVPGTGPPGFKHPHVSCRPASPMEFLSPVMGLAILAISQAFFYLYLVDVHPIVEVRLQSGEFQVSVIQCRNRAVSRPYTEFRSRQMTRADDAN